MAGIHCNVVSCHAKDSSWPPNKTATTSLFILCYTHTKCRLFRFFWMYFCLKKWFLSSGMFYVFVIYSLSVAGGSICVIDVSVRGFAPGCEGARLVLRGIVQPV